ncbi:MAG: hypothetical protein WCB27_10390 [Thermoguttaceae bacterium]
MSDRRKLQAVFVKAIARRCLALGTTIGKNLSEFDDEEHDFY